MNDGAFINSCNLQAMRCVLCHYDVMNVDFDSLVHGACEL